MSSLKSIFFLLVSIGITTVQNTVPPRSTFSTTTAGCTDGATKIINCVAHYCYSGSFQPFEFVASEECCRRQYHPRCEYMGYGTSTTTTPPPTTTNLGCRPGDSRVVNCVVHICTLGRLRAFEFTATRECCQTQSHPKCDVMGFDSTAQPCTAGTTKLINCNLYRCHMGTLRPHGFFLSPGCCRTSGQSHPGCDEIVG
ncbi:hypothetical protein ScPMuIL_001953 [Solemya velum]